MSDSPIDAGSRLHHPVDGSCSYCASSLPLFELLAHFAGSSDVDAIMGLHPKYQSLLSRSAALHDSMGRARLKTLEAVGDAALTTVVALVADAFRWSVGDYSRIRSSCTNNTYLNSLFFSSPFSSVVIMPAGTSGTSGVAGAKTLEAVLGAVCIEFGLAGVFQAALAFGVFRGCQLPGGVDSTGLAAELSLGGKLAVLVSRR